VAVDRCHWFNDATYYRPFTVALCYSDTYSLRMRSTVAASSVMIDNFTQCHVSAEINNRSTAMLTMERRLVLLKI